MRSEYVGGGLAGALAAQLDADEREHRVAHRALLRQVVETTADAPELRAFLAYVRDQVHAALVAAGYHQHKRGEWRRRMGTAKQPTAIVGPQPFDEWVDATLTAMGEQDPPPAAVAEYRKLLKLQPVFARHNGDMSLIVRRAIRSFYSDARTTEAIVHQSAELRKGLGIAGATPLEQLLIDQVLLCWHDYHAHELVYVARFKDGLALDVVEQYERILASKQKRYLSAIATLADVRRKLNIQVNINLPGGQQVIANEVHSHGAQ